MNPAKNRLKLNVMTLSLLAKEISMCTFLNDCVKKFLKTQKLQCKKKRKKVSQLGMKICVIYFKKLS